MGLLDKAKDALNSDQVEEVSDSILDKVEEVATEKLGAEHADKAKEIRDEVDNRIGNEGAGA